MKLKWEHGPHKLFSIFCLPVCYCFRSCLFACLVVCYCCRFLFACFLLVVLLLLLSLGLFFFVVCLFCCCCCFCFVLLCFVSCLLIDSVNI